MKKVLLTCTALASIGLMNQAHAQAWSQDFGSGMPSNWVYINDANTPNSSNLSALAVSKMTAKAWDTSRTKGGTDYCAFSISTFNPAATANRWMITHSFTVSANQYLIWEDFSITTPADSLEIWISPTAGTTTASFTANPYKAPAPDINVTGTYANRHVVSLSAYVGQTIRVAFREHSTNKSLIYVDNVSVATLPTSEMALTTFEPSATSPQSYGTAGSNVTFTGTITNNGANPITSYTLNYKQGSNATVSIPMTANIPALGTGTFTASANPYTIPAVGTYPIKAWVSLTGDTTHANDSATTTITGVPFMPSKKLLVEEATGTWCGWCVRGIVYMDSLWGLHPNNVSLIAVHDQDPMMVSSYDNYIGTLISGYPSVVIDRREVADPSDLLDIYSAENNYFGFADITLGTMTISGTSFSLPVTVKPAINLSGDYRLVMTLTEDNVHGTTDHTQGASLAWDQHNYYTSTLANLPLSGQGVNYQTQPEYIPAANMFYNFVGRSITPSTTGTAGVLPTSMTASSTYNATLTATLNSSWNKSKMRAVVMLVRASDGAVLNSNWATGKLSVSNVAAGVTGLQLYPNPAGETATARFTLDGSTHVNIQLIDAMGRVVSTVADQSMTAGEQEVKINTSGIASGLYNVRITTEKGSMTERLSVIK
ncbi:choice-of-anchor J domain-containing protein [Chitinophagaceae bacterium MMS25-I14]